MARSETAVTDAENYHIEYSEGREESTLVVQTPDVTITIEGSSAEVRRQFEEHYAAALNLTAEEIAEVSETYPTPELDDLESVFAGEFYDQN